MIQPRPFVLTIDSFDPCGGSGVVSDVKTIEKHRVQGLAICSALTAQYDKEVFDCQWIAKDNILKQIIVLCSKYEINVVKIGAVENIEVFLEIISLIKKIKSDVKIIWNPINICSETYLTDFKREDILDVLKEVFLLTLNEEQANFIFNSKNLNSAISKFIDNKHLHSLLLYGGCSLNILNDDLFYEGGKSSYYGKNVEQFPKQGVSSVYSSSIASNLALGKKLKQSCKKSKRYVNEFILSTKENLGRHC